MQIHATCCALGPAAHDTLPAAVLLLGASGSGKSDLALRLVDAGFVLVADDRVDLASEGGAVIASGPDALAGLIEVRGIGILRLGASVRRARVVLAASLASRETIPRLPEQTTIDLVGTRVPAIALDPELPSAVARIRLALDVVCGRAVSRCGALGDSAAQAVPS
ncbi:HPr kinase/phosphorylase [Elioraea rosea]|uniref:HPr kinase/phosphorylase n=1 Tax=Elioraea rosea TaxID=2492390 RepID=UPI0011832483|nr:HPr kinase/phosphatase C-terminal domain-containing protein [Elioraea rosea]